MKKEEKKMKLFSKESDQINGLFDKGCSFEGKLTFDGVVQVNGDFQGEVFSDGTLIVGSDATVKARIQVNTLIVDGKVEGLAEVKNRVEIRSQAQFIGDVITPGLVVEEGGILHGACQMQQRTIESYTSDLAASKKSKKGTKEDLFAENQPDTLM
jgi:cytoskeletal protein CcmA (bactofilin family)